MLTLGTRLCVWGGSRGGGKETEGKVVEEAAREVDEQTERELGVRSYISVVYGRIWFTANSWV